MERIRQELAAEMLLRTLRRRENPLLQEYFDAVEVGGEIAQKPPSEILLERVGGTGKAGRIDFKPIKLEPLE